MDAQAAYPSVPAATAYLTSNGRAVGRVRYNDVLVRRGGYALYFTVMLFGGRSAVLIKVCEDARGRVTGSSNVSYGEPSC